MSSEPGNKIEALLGAYAARRRRAADPASKLPPDVRRALQAEVRRQRTGPRQADDSRGWLAILAALWPRIAVAGGIVVVLAGALWWLSPSDRDTTLASAPQPSLKAVTAPQFTTNSAAADKLGQFATVSIANQRTQDFSSRVELDRIATGGIALAEGAPTPPAFNFVSAPGASVSTVSLLSALSPLAQASGPKTLTNREDGAGDGRAATARYYARAEIAAPATAPAAPQALEALPPNRPPATKRDANDLGDSPAEPRPVLLTAAPTTPPPTTAPNPVKLNYRAAPSPAPTTTTAVAVPARTALWADQYVAADTRRRMTASGPRPAAYPILTNFALEQRGAMVRLIDTDGSIYEGRILSAVTTANGLKENETQLAKAAGARANSPTLPTQSRSQSIPTAPDQFTVQQGQQSPSAESELAFEVAGTNVSLRQPVVLTGTLSLPPGTTLNLQPQTQIQFQSLTELNPTGGAGTPQQSVPGRGAQGLGTRSRRPVNQGPIPVLRLQGRGHFGVTNELQVDAVPVPW